MPLRKIENCPTRGKLNFDNLLCPKVSTYRIKSMHSYLNAEVMVKLAGDKLVRVVVLVRWKQVTGTFSVNVRECSEVKGETWRYVYTHSSAFAAFTNKICTERCDIQVGELMTLKVCICNTIMHFSADTLTTSINN